MAKVVKPNLTPAEARARILAAANKDRTAYQLPTVCRHGFPPGELDHTGCVAR